MRTSYCNAQHTADKVHMESRTDFRWLNDGTALQNAGRTASTQHSALSFCCFVCNLEGLQDVELLPRTHHTELLCITRLDNDGLCAIDLLPYRSTSKTRARHFPGITSAFHNSARRKEEQHAIWDRSCKVQNRQAQVPLVRCIVAILIAAVQTLSSWPATQYAAQHLHQEAPIMKWQCFTTNVNWNMTSVPA